MAYTLLTGAASGIRAARDDGRVDRGVEEIDPMEPLELASFPRRRVALVTLPDHVRKDSEAGYQARMQEGRAAG